MSFVVKYSDRPTLLEPMITLAREELLHFHEVFKEIQRRGLRLLPDEKDLYVHGLLKKVRHGREEHFLDRLLVSAVIEARGCERFQMLGHHLDDEKMRPWYERLGREEAGHYKIFLQAANHHFPREVVKKRLEELVEFEGELMLSLPFLPRVH